MFCFDLLFSKEKFIYLAQYLPIFLSIALLLKEINTILIWPGPSNPLHRVSLPLAHNDLDRFFERQTPRYAAFGCDKSLWSVGLYRYIAEAES